MCISLYWSLYSAIPLGPAQVLPSPSRSLLRHLFDSPVCAYLLSHFWFPWFLTLCDPMNHSPPGSSVHGDSPGKSIGLGSHSLLQGIFLTQGLSPCLRHCRQSLYWLNHWGSPWWPCRAPVPEVTTFKASSTSFLKCESQWRGRDAREVQAAASGVWK